MVDIIGLVQIAMVTEKYLVMIAVVMVKLLVKNVKVMAIQNAVVEQVDL